MSVKSLACFCRHGCTPYPPLLIVTWSGNRLPHLAQRNRRSFSGTSPRPTSMIACGSAGACWRQDRHEKNRQSQPSCAAAWSGQSGDCRSSSSPKEDSDEQHEHRERHRHDDKQDCHYRRERWRLLRIVIVKEPAATDPHSLFLRRQRRAPHDLAEQVVGKVASAQALLVAPVVEVQQMSGQRAAAPGRFPVGASLLSVPMDDPGRGGTD
jgi:hypothetical protein